MTGTSGGWRGMDGARRRLALILAAGFLLILLLVTIANATSMLSDLRSAGTPETARHVWGWELTSVLAWLAVTPAIWWLVATVRPPRFGWVATAAIGIAASLPVSGVHIALMVAGRQLFYALDGERYRFFGGLADRLLYEYRKDAVTVVQFAGLAAIAQRLLAPRPIAMPAVSLPVLLVTEGAVTHRVPADEIDRAEAAGNYVEIGWHGRTLLYRATLAAVEAELGDGFVRIGRSRLVRRAAMRAVTVERSGDFTVTLTDGTAVRGSRRYRAGIEARDGV